MKRASWGRGRSLAPPGHLHIDIADVGVVRGGSWQEEDGWTDGGAAAVSGG